MKFDRLCSSFDSSNNPFAATVVAELSAGRGGDNGALKSLEIKILDPGIH